MTRRNATSAPPRSRPSQHSHSHRPHVRDVKELAHTAEEKERGFEWTPGLVLALVGTLTWLDHTFEKTRRKSESHKQESHKGAGHDRSCDRRSVRSPERSRSRGRSRRERERSKVRFDTGGDEIIDDSYYEYGPKRGRSAWR